MDMGQLVRYDSINDGLLAKFADVLDYIWWDNGSIWITKMILK